MKITKIIKHVVCFCLASVIRPGARNSTWSLSFKAGRRFHFTAIDSAEVERAITSMESSLKR